MNESKLNRSKLDKCVNNEINCRVLLALKKGATACGGVFVTESSVISFCDGWVGGRDERAETAAAASAPNRRIIRGRRSEDAITRCARRRWSNANKNESLLVSFYFSCSSSWFLFRQISGSGRRQRTLFRRIIVCVLWTIVSPLEDCDERTTPTVAAVTRQHGRLDGTMFQKVPESIAQL